MPSDAVAPNTAARPRAAPRLATPLPIEVLSAADLVRRDRAAVACWLLAMCAMLLVMVSLGGATRLTGSGLSIMEWAPVAGVLPPLDEAEWQRLFMLYRQIPQYALLHEGFGLAGFKQIFWLEWVHRFWGRLVGVAFVVPLLVFWVRGALSWRLLPRLLLLLALGGLQGAVGWFMVRSGLQPDSVAVSAYRLVAHLVLALGLYAVLFWTALSIGRGPLGAARGGAAAMWMAVVAGGTAATIAAGGFVAGLHAGLVYTDFPLMDGRLVPQGYGDLSPWVRNLFENPAAVQFDHRLLASLTALIALAAVLRLWPVVRLRPALAGIALAVLLQYTLGVATLLAAVPVWLGVAHQAGAVLLLTASLAGLHVALLPASSFAARLQPPE